MNKRSQLMTNQIDVIQRYPPNYNNLENYSYVGTQASDQALALLKKYKNKGEPKRPWGMVFNTDPIKDPGQHWVVLYASESDPTIEIMDSYGSESLKSYGPYVQEILNFVNVNPKMIKLQGPSTYVCGHYCLAYLYARTHGVTPLKFIESFSSVKDRDKKVCQFVCKVMVDKSIKSKYNDKVGPLGQLCQGCCCK